MSFKEIIRIRKEERLPAAVLMVLALVLNTIFVQRVNEYILSTDSADMDLVELLRCFHISGYDPYALFSFCQWDVIYNAYRHPLLAFLLYPFFILNSATEHLTGLNIAAFLAALLLIINALYALLFFHRILRDIIGISLIDSHILSAFFFSMAYILQMLFVPDHFAFSMTLLLLTAWMAGKKMKEKDGRWSKIWLFVLVSGITLSNGIKVALAALYVKGRKVFRPKYLLLAFVLPTVVLWALADFQFHTFSIPRAEKMAQKAAVEKARMETLKLKKKGIDRKVAPEKPKEVKKKVDFLSWIDTETDRVESLVENVFGESIQLHQRYTLMDGLGKRPLFVTYDWILNYIAEAIIIVLFLLGIWTGFHSSFLWLLLSWTGCDALLHLGLGFGLNEVYIMAPHWLFTLPLTIAFLLTKTGSYRWLTLSLRSLLSLLSLFLLMHNGWYLLNFLL